MTHKRLLSTSFAALITIFLAGCSWTTDFAISNTTGSDLHASYRTRTCPEGNFITIPVLQRNSELKDEQKRWNDLTLAEYSCDEKEGVVKTVIPSGMALRVARIARSHLKNVLGLRYGVANPAPVLIYYV
jgi:hypothetical protein